MFAGISEFVGDENRYVSFTPLKATIEKKWANIVIVAYFKKIKF